MSKKSLQFSFALVFVVGILFALLFAGTFLIKSDKLEKADAIVVLMGNIPNRILHAADLYHQGLADKVIFVEEGNQSLNLLKDKGISIKSSSQQMAAAAIQLGILPDHLIIIPGDAHSTRMEAQRLSYFLEGKSQVLALDSLSNELMLVNSGLDQTSLSELDTFIIVSSPSHTRRAYSVFTNEFSHAVPPINFLVSPSPYDSFTGKGWYKSREDIQVVVYEWLKRIGG